MEDARLSDYNGEMLPDAVSRVLRFEKIAAISSIMNPAGCHGR